MTALSFVWVHPYSQNSGCDNHIGLSEQSKPLTVFTTHSGKFQWNVLPFGIGIGVQTFSFVINKAIGHCSDFAANYLDDIIVFSRTAEDHMEHLEKIFKAKFESFFGDEKKNKLDFDMWERQVLSAATTHSGAAIKQAMMQSLKGQALMVTSALPPDASWEKLLQALKIKYQDKAPYDVLMAQFYGTKMDIDEKCASFGTRLEQKLNQVSLQYPDKISETMYWNCVRERFFHGLPKDMRTNLRTQFDSGATYYQMLELARIVESENFHENSGTEIKTTSNKGKSKVNVASVDNPTQQIQQMQQLQGAVKGLTKLLQNNQQQTELPQIPQFVSQTGQKGTQENVNTLPQATNGQGSTAPQRGRGGRGGYRGRGGRGRGGLILCYWCRDFLPKEQANHKVAQCPYQKQAKNDWWKNQLSTVQGNAQVAQSNTEEN